MDGGLDSIDKKASDSTWIALIIAAEFQKEEG